MEAKLLVLFATLAFAAAGPVRLNSQPSDTCATTCTKSSKFAYTPGQTFTYQYSVHTETSVNGASEDRAALSITGHADIEVFDQCEMVLQLRDVEVYETSPSGMVRSSGSQELATVLASTHLRFSFQDGVMAELCPSRREDPWALNIKRGLLSALQNSMDFQQQKAQTVREADVTGQCETVYEVTSSSYWGGKTTITRRKDLSACTERHGYLGSLQTTRYNMESGMQNLPLMESSHDCEQVVSQGIVQSSVCTEKHLFKPFSAQKGGALTTVTQSLTFLSKRDGTKTHKDWIDSRASMTFDHGFDARDSREARARAEDVLSKLCDMTKNGIELDVPRTFTQLVSAIRKLDSSDMRDIYRQLKRKTICRDNNERTKKFFLDALPMAASDEAVDMMKDLMIDGDVTGLEADLWLASMAFIPHPTAPMVDSVQALLENEGLKLKSMLAVSSMAHNYCPMDGCNSRSVDNIITTLDNIIGYRCSVNDGNIKTVLTTLSALGNTGQSRAANVVSRCLGNRSPMEVRVAAVQAFRRMPCVVSREALMSMVKDGNEDTELRIASYLQAMTCPTKMLIGELQIIMEKEPEDSQLGSFIYTHLSNLMETSSPLKQDIRQLLKDVELGKLFYLNPLKYSRNYEKSAFLKMINSGAQAESNVIFSAESPIPRSVSANLTVDVLGHSINLLEVGGRLEGMEYLIEMIQAHVFGNKPAKDRLDWLKGSGYARIFGNELLYNRFQGSRSLMSGNTFNLLDFLIRLSKDHDYLFTQSMQFLDSTVTIPTSTGLPLTLSVNGTATVDIKATGKMDLRKVSKSPRTLHVEGEIRPSGAVNVDGVMSVDARYARTGVKMTSSLQSSMAMKGRVELDRGRTLNVQVDMPDDRMEILDVRTKFFVLINEKEQEQKMITDNRKEFQLCTGEFLSKVTGLEMCGQLQFPNASMQSEGPYFPMTGPSSVSLVLHKRDSHTGYKLLAKRVENKRSSVAQLSFDTPGSTVVRAISFDMMIDYPQKEAEISFGSPWKKTSVKGSLVNEAGLKSMTGSVVIDDDQTYSLTSEVKVDEQSDKKMTVLTPMVQLRRPGADTITLMGAVKMDSRWKSLSTDLTLNGVTRKSLQLQGSFTNSQVDKSVSGTFKYGKKTYSAQAGVNYNMRSKKSAQFNPLVLVTTPSGNLLKLEGSTDYRQDRMLKSDHTLTIPCVLDIPVNFKCDITKKGRRKGPKYNVDIRFKSKPFTSNVNGVVVLADTAFTNLKVDYNAYRRGRDRITINGKLSNKSTAAFKKYMLSSSVEFKRNPDWNVETSVDFEHKKRRSGGSLTMKLGKNPKDKQKHITMSASLDRTIKSLSEVDIDYKMKAIAPMLGVNYAMNGAHSHSPTSLASQMTLNYNKDKTVKAEVNLKDKSDRQVRLNGDASLSFPGHSYEVDSALKNKGKQLVHTVNMKSHKGPFLTLTSTYKPNKDDTHEVTANLDVNGYKPVKMSGSAGLDMNNLQLQGQVLHGKDSYSLNALSKISKGPRGKWTLSASYPSRTVGFSVIGGVSKNSADVDLDLAWDKDRDDDAKISLSMSGTHKNTRAITSSSAKLDLTSPFADKVSAAVSFDNDQKRYGLDGKVTLGAKSNTYFSTLNVRKPLSPGNVQMTWSGGSPMRGLKRVMASIDHDADSRSLNTVLKASKGKEQILLTVKGKDNSDRNNNDLSGDVSLKTAVRGLEDVRLTLAHKDDGRKYTSSGAFVMNSDRYSAELDMTHSMRDWTLQNNGQLKIVSPSQNSATTWKYRSSENDVGTTLDSSWGRGKQLHVEMTGNKVLIGELKSVNGALTIKSPWKQLRDLSMTLNHEMSGSYCKHKASLILNSEKKASSELNYRVGDHAISGDFMLTAPYMDAKSGSMNANLRSYPVTGHVELHMGPGQSITGDASFSKTRDMNMEGNVHLTTPYRSLQAITLSGSTSSDGEDVVAKANLDYGVRQNYDATVMFRPRSLTMGRVVVHTPLEKLSALNTGYQISGVMNDFDVTADFTLEPMVNKYSASVNWKLDEELSGKLRINTPLRDLRYMQLTANSQMKGKGRKSRVVAEYYPRQTYSLTSFYTADLPIIFSLNAETPIQGYDSFGLSVKHQQDDSSILTHGELQYLPDKTIESTLSLNWRRNIDGSLLVKTPFPDFEESKLSVRHDGDLNDFTSHAEMELMRETMAADAQFKYGYTTSGSFSLVSSLDDVEKIEANFNKRGYMDSFKGSASLAYGEKKMEGSVSHKITSRMLKSSLTFNSPFTKLVRSSVDVSNRQSNLQATLSGQYGPQKVESKSSLQMDGNDFSGSSTLNYNLDGGDHQVLATISKKGDMNNVEMAASLSSPYTEDISLALQHNSALPYSMKTVLSGSYGQDYTFKTDNSFNNRANSFSVSSASSYKMGGALQEFSSSVSKKGPLSDMTVSAVAKYQDQEITVDGQLNTENGINTKLQLDTPFDSFERLGFDLTHTPTNRGFRQQGSLVYMTGRKIQHSVTLSYRGLEEINLDASLTSPIHNLEKNTLTVRHDYSRNRKQCTGSIQLESSYLGINAITYKRQGDMEQMTLDGSLVVDGEKVEGHMEWVPLTHGYRHTIELTIRREKFTSSMEFQKTDEMISSKMRFALPRLILSFDGEGAVSGFNSEMNGKISITTTLIKDFVLATSVKKTGPPNDVKLEMEVDIGSGKITTVATFKNAEGDVSGKLDINTPFRNLRNLGGSFKHSGDLNRFNTEGSLMLSDEEVSGKVTFYRYEWRRVEATAELTTPFPELKIAKASYRHAGGADSFTCTSSLEYDDSQISADLRATFTPKYDMALTVKTPFRKIVADAKLESLANTHTASSSLDMGRGQRYAIEGSLDMDSSPMTMAGKLTTPYSSLRSVQVAGSHSGQVNDFSSSFTFNSPKTDVIKGDAMLKFNSIFDVNAAASVNSEISGLEDVRVEVKNTDMGNSKTGHALFRWAPERQMSLDGTYVLKDYWYNKDLQADLTLTTPFQRVRTANLHVQHEQKEQKYAPKVELTLNGESKLDAEGELNTGDNPSLSLLTRTPWPAQVTGALSHDGSELETDVFVNWDRDSNDQNVRVQTKARNLQDDYQTNIDYSLKIIHPSRTVSSGMTLQTIDKTITSEGFVSWDDRSDRKVFYTLELKDVAKYYGSAYEGKMRMGGPGRTLETTGSYSLGRQMNAVDASFSWDADHDTTKQMGFNAKLTKGEKTKADLTLRLPAIGKEVHIDHEMALNQGRTVWDGRTEVSYSPDIRKTLTLASSIKDISDSYDSGKNYSLAVSITHPHTFTDISFNSHIGATGDRYSAAMDTVYLTSRRTRNNMVLRGEIDRLRRQIDLQLDSPMKKVSLRGEIQSTDPYVIRLTNTFNSEDSIQSQLHIDPETRSLQFSTNYDLEDPNKQLVMKAGYINASAVSAELYRLQRGRKFSDAILFSRLNTSTLLHTRLAWRPQMFTDLQNYIQLKTVSYSDDLRHTLSAMQEDVGQEMSDKYASITKELQAELSPVLDLMQNELSRLGQQMERARKNLNRAYRRNDLYMQDMGLYVQELIEVMRDYTITYQMLYKDMVNDMRTKLQDMTDYNIKQNFDTWVDAVTEQLVIYVAEKMEDIELLITQLDDNLWAWTLSAQEQWEELKNHPQVQGAHKRVKLLGSDFRWLMGYMGNKVTQMSVPEQYTSAIYNARDSIAGGMSEIMGNRHVMKVKDVANEAYQQGAWAYRYWNVEKNAQKHLESLIHLVGQLIKEEFEEMTQKMQFLRQSKVTVYDPEQGEIQVDLVLPVEFKSLQELPDFQSYIDQAEGVIDRYMPDTDTIFQYYKQYAPWVKTNTTPQDDIMAQFEAYKPSVSRRRKPRYFSRARRV